MPKCFFRIKLVICSSIFILPQLFADNLSQNTSLTAKIIYPTKNSLVRADVPVYGIACGDNFKEYFLEYGEGSAPEEWHLISQGKNEVKEGEKGFLSIPRLGPMKGNLGTWETGLDSYYYKDYKVDLKGEYTLRLTVFDKNGNSVTDEVPVEVGEVVTNIYGGIIKSGDNNVTIEVPEHALYDTAMVMSVSEIDKNRTKLIIDPPYRLIGNIYEVKPSATKYAREITIRMKTTENADNADIYEYDLEKCVWKSLYSEKDGEWLKAKTSELFVGRSYFAVLSSDEKSNPMKMPLTDNLKIKTYSGAKVEEICENGREYYKITNLENPGYFACALKSESYNAGEFPMVEFKYKMPKGIKLNLFVKVKKKWYDIVFTDEPKTYLRTNIKKIGKIGNVIDDEKWHEIRFNLQDMLSTQTNDYQVDEIFMADFNSLDYMELKPGNNPKGASYYIADFKVKPFDGNERSSLSLNKGSNWILGVDDGSPDEFSYEKYDGQYKDSDTPDNYNVGMPYGRLERAVAYDDKETNIYFNLNKGEAAKEYKLSIDACNCDLRDFGYVEFDVFINGVKLGNYTCIYEKGDIWEIPVKKGLQEGENKIAVRWVGGGNWIAWDCIKFAPKEKDINE